VHALQWRVQVGHPTNVTVQIQHAPLYRNNTIYGMISRIIVWVGAEEGEEE